MMRRLVFSGLVLLVGMTTAMGQPLHADTDRLLTLQLAPATGPIALTVGDQGWQIEPDDAGFRLLITPVRLEGRRRIAQRKQAVTMTYWPREEAALKAVAALGEARSWRGRLIPMQFTRRGGTIDFWFEGQWIGRLEHPAGEPATLSSELRAGDVLLTVADLASPSTPQWTPLHMVHAATTAEAWSEARAMELGDVPFIPPKTPLDLRQAQWVDWRQDPGDYYESYDSGPYVLHDPRMTVLRLPAQDLVAVHLLACVDDDPQLDDVITLRVGRFGGIQDRVVFHDVIARLPRQSTLKGDDRTVEIDGRRYAPVRVPVALAIAQDLGGVLQIEVTKQVRLAVRQTDPNRFRRRPLGLDSGVRIAAITLERPAVSMHVSSREVGHAFCEPQTPRFQVQLRNHHDSVQRGSVQATATDVDGVSTQAVAAYELAPQSSAVTELELPVRQRGYYDVAVSLQDSSGRTLLRRETSMALLPPLSDRRHRDRSPLGCWDFGGQHVTSDDPDQVGPLYEKLGFRYGMFTFKPEQRARWGVMKGSEPTITNGSSRQPAGASAGSFARTIERHPDQVPAALIFHEGIISNIQAQRTPDLFHDRPPYVLSEAESARFERLWEDALASARHMREKFPQIHLRFGNGLLTFKESFYARGFPGELFDSAGNEAGSFSRPPETQPPDPVAYNASMWMDRQLLDAHGYAKTPVTQCFEIGCASSNPGNLSLRTQADYVARMALISLAWRVPEIRPGLISDVGNSYYFSHWGAAGYAHAFPELNVKPAFVAMSTLTWILDGAELVKELPTGSAVIHSLLFRRADGDHVHALWTIRGTRRVVLQLAPGQSATWINDQGRQVALQPDVLDRVAVTIGPSPGYVRSADGSSVVSLGTPEYEPPKDAAVLDPLASLSDWQVQGDPELMLDYYNSLTPRRHGQFNWSLWRDAGSDREVWRVEPAPGSMSQRKPTLPRYMAIRHRKGLPLPADAGAMSIWVNGNGSWGRVIYDLQDASGQRWTSIGAPMPDAPPVWDHASLDPLQREELRKIGVNDWNSDDVFGESRINHDGWRQLTFVLPGQYPGEGYGWPGNSQWRHDGDGRVRHPLTLKGMIVELPPRTLTLTRFDPVLRPWIALRDLGTVSGSQLP
jgi:hypothetical protein